MYVGKRMKSTRTLLRFRGKREKSRTRMTYVIGSRAITGPLRVTVCSYINGALPLSARIALIPLKTLPTF